MVRYRFAPLPVAPSDLEYPVYKAAQDYAKKVFILKTKSLTAELKADKGFIDIHIKRSGGQIQEPTYSYHGVSPDLVAKLQVLVKGS